MATSKYRAQRREKYHVLSALVTTMVETFDKDQNAAIKMGYEIFGDCFKNSLLRYINQLSIATSFKLAVTRCFKIKVQQMKEAERG